MRLAGLGVPLSAFALNHLPSTALATVSRAGRPSAVGVTAVNQNDRQERRLGTAAAAAAAGGTSGDNFAARVLIAPARDGGRAEGKGTTATSRPEGEAATTAPSRRAYATLLYSDFIEGTRALGQSLRESGTSADTVVLVTPDVRQETREKLAQDGWIVRPVAVEANPNQNFQSRLVFVYTKLLIVEMEAEYDRIVFLDADTLVLENVDELFECEPFCAVMRHSELLNSGVVVITPSKELYGHMHELIGELDSYTGGDQGFLNSFYPYFAACPAFEPYPILGSRLPGVGSGIADEVTSSGGGGGGSRRDLGQGGEAEAERGAVVVAGGEGEEDERRRRRRGLADEQVRSKGWSCKRLPTRYNGDWPLLFVDGDLQVVQGKAAGPDAPDDWKRRKRVKILHFTFGTAKPWNWWTYPFLPYVDLWLEAFYRLGGTGTGEGDAPPNLRLSGNEVNEMPSSVGGPTTKRKRPRWSGVVGQLVHGLAPLLVVAVLWKVAKRWTAAGRALQRMGIVLARYTIPVKALNARSLSGSIFNLAAGLALALSAAVVAFNAVPAARLGAARPEAAWAFFWARATALVVISEGFFLILVSLKARQVFKTPARVDNGVQFISISPLDSDAITDNGDGGVTTPMLTPLGGRRAAATSAAGAAAAATGLQQQPVVQLAVTPAGAEDVGGGGSGVAEGSGKHGGASVGGACGPRRLALTETLAHLAFLSALAVSIVSAPLLVGLNGFPASREIVPGIARLVLLLVAFTFSAVRLPPLWAAHARSFGSISCGGDNGGGGGSSSSVGGGGGEGGVGAGVDGRCSGWHRGRRVSRTARFEMQAERTALGNMSPLSDHHNA